MGSVHTDYFVGANVIFRNCSSGLLLVGSHTASATGGAVFLGSGGELTDSDFWDCQSQNGGAVMLYQGNLSLTRCRFRNCIANSTGGAISSGAAARMRIYDSIFEGCSVRPK